MNILFLNAGRRCELIQCFKKALKKHGGGSLFATDISDLAPALFKVDHAELFPHSSSPDFAQRLIAFCRQHEIDAVIPTIDPDLENLCRIRHQFEQACPKTRLLISPEKTITLCRNKTLSRQKFADLGIEVPQPIDPNKQRDQLQFPLFVKPPGGSAGIGARKIDNVEELDTAIRQQPDLMVEPYIPGAEYTVDVLCDLNTTPLFAVARRRIKIRSGEVLQGIVDMNPDVLALAKQAAAGFGCTGPVTVQFRNPSAGRFVAIELNARMGGGLPLAIAAGADWPEYIIQLLKNQSPSLPSSIRDGLIMSRYDQSEFFLKTNFPQPKPTDSPTGQPALSTLLQGIKAVILDLDDTIYPERDFVFNGYRAAAEQVWQDHNVNIEPTLKQLFNSGLRGDLFSLALQRHHINADESYIKTLVACYRGQQTDLQPYIDTLPLLQTLKQQGIKCGLITDGRADVQHRKIAALKLEPWFDAIVVSDEHGGQKAWKPSTIPFEAIRQELAVDFHQLIYIADNPAKDFFPCNKLGMKSIRIRRPLTEHERKEPASADDAPSAELDSFSALITALLNQ